MGGFPFPRGFLLLAMLPHRVLASVAAEDELLGNSTSNCTDHHHHAERCTSVVCVGHMEPVLFLLFVFSALLIGAFVKWSLQDAPVPYTVLLLVVGFIIGLPARYDIMGCAHVLGSVGQSWVDASKIDPHLLLGLFLPPLVFESAFSIEPHLFKRTVGQALLLAGPGLLISSIMTGIFVKSIMVLQYQTERTLCLSHEGSDMPCNSSQYDPSLFGQHRGDDSALFCPESCFYSNTETVEETEGWTMPASMLLGTVLSATDPVAVVALLKELGAKKSLGTLIEGESLMNDGTAYVLFLALFDSVEWNTDPDFGNLVLKFLYMSTVGPLIGVLFGKLSVMWLARVWNNALVEITITISTAYLTFIVADISCGASGVLALVALGVYYSYFGRVAISPEVEEFLHEFWEMLGYLANTLIFILTGVIIATNLSATPLDFVYLIGLYIWCHIARLLAFFVLRPLMNRVGYEVSMNDMWVCVWGGLRGAVGLALALMVNIKLQNEEVQERYPAAKELARQVLFQTSMFVVMTLLINSTTIGRLLSKLGMDKVPLSKEMIFTRAMDMFKEVGDKEITQLKGDPLYCCASWPDVRGYRMRIPRIKVQFFSKDDSQALIDEMELLEARRRFLVAVKVSYWNRFKQGLLTRSGVRELVEITDQALDRKCAMDEWEQVKSYLHVLGGHDLAKTLLIPGLRTISRRVLFARLQHGYDVATAFLAAREEACELLTKFLDSEENFQIIKAKAHKDIEIVKKEIFDIQRVFPEISASIATTAAARTMLNTQRHAVCTLEEEGMLDGRESERMVLQIEKQMKRLQNAPPSISLPSKSTLLRELPWLAALPDSVFSKIEGGVEEVLFEDGDTIVNQGEINEDVFLLARGTVQIEIEVDGETIKVEEVGVGSVIGEMACITNKPRFATVRCNSPVISFCIRGLLLTSILRDSDGGGKDLFNSIWATAGRRLAENVLATMEPYNHWTRRRLRGHVSEWSLCSPDPENLEVCFQRHFVLLFGEAKVMELKEDGTVLEEDDFQLHLEGLVRTPSGSAVTNSHAKLPKLLKRQLSQLGKNMGLSMTVSPEPPCLVASTIGSELYCVRFSDGALALVPPDAFFTETQEWKRNHRVTKVSKERIRHTISAQPSLVRNTQVAAPPRWRPSLVRSLRLSYNRHIYEPNLLFRSGLRRKDGDEAFASASAKAERRLSGTLNATPDDTASANAIADSHSAEINHDRQLRNSIMHTHKATVQLTRGGGGSAEQLPSIMDNAGGRAMMEQRRVSEAGQIVGEHIARTHLSTVRAAGPDSDRRRSSHRKSSTSKRSFFKAPLVKASTIRNEIAALTGARGPVSPRKPSFATANDSELPRPSPSGPQKLPPLTAPTVNAGALSPDLADKAAPQSSETSPNGIEQDTVSPLPSLSSSSKNKTSSKSQEDELQLQVSNDPQNSEDDEGSDEKPTATDANVSMQPPVNCVNRTSSAVDLTAGSNYRPSGGMVTISRGHSSVSFMRAESSHSNGSAPLRRLSGSAGANGISRRVTGGISNKVSRQANRTSRVTPDRR